MMQKIRWILLILVIVLLLAAILQNNQVTDINLLWLKRSTPVSVLLISTTAIGFLFGAATTASMLRRGRKPHSDTQPDQANSATGQDESPLNTAAD